MFHDEVFLEETQASPHRLTIAVSIGGNFTNRFFNTLTFQSSIELNNDYNMYNNTIYVTVRNRLQLENAFCIVGTINEKNEYPNEPAKFPTEDY